MMEQLLIDVEAELLNALYCDAEAYYDKFIFRADFAGQIPVEKYSTMFPAQQELIDRVRSAINEIEATE